jgi:hypothetical protein
MLTAWVFQPHVASVANESGFVSRDGEGGAVADD